MVHIDLDEASPENRIWLASGIAEQFGATLIGISGCMPVLPAIGSDDTGVERQKIAAAIAVKEQLFARLVKDAQHPKEWRFALDSPNNVVPREARAADLVVIGKDRTSNDPTRAIDPATTILRMGRPVLTVPHSVSSLKPKRVLVGWQDSRESRRAIQDALPLLQNADEVLLTQVCDLPPAEGAKTAISDVAQYLIRHRVTASAGVMLKAGGTTAEELMRVAQDEGVDLIVAGAYGHSRLGEWVFGGVTRELLASSPVCCLFSH